MARRWTGADTSDGGEPVDARLVAGLRSRTPDAFAGLHEQYATGIYNLALRMVRHTSDAEDITQDVLIRAFERVPRDREVLLRPWLYRMTINRCYDHLRASARRRPVSLAGHHGVSDADGHAREADPASPHDPFEQSELNRLLEAALSDITRRQRAALLLKDVHGLSLVEVGACLDLTPGSVEVLLARARKAFRASFEAHCGPEGRPVPSSVGVLAALPMQPLPPALLSLPVPPVSAAVSPLSLGVPPIAAAAGGGIGAALGVPATLKTAALILAAAATVSTAEVAATHSDAPRSSRSAVASVVPGTAVSVAGTAGTGSVGTPDTSAAPAALGVAASPSASPLAEAPLPSASPTDSSVPAVSPSPLGISSPAPTPVATPIADPLPTTDPTPTADPTPTTDPTPTAAPTPTADPTPLPSPTPSPPSAESPSPVPAP